MVTRREVVSGMAAVMALRDKEKAGNPDRVYKQMRWKIRYLVQESGFFVGDVADLEETKRQIVSAVRDEADRLERATVTVHEVTLLFREEMK